MVGRIAVAAQPARAGQVAGELAGIGQPDAQPARQIADADRAGGQGVDQRGAVPGAEPIGLEGIAQRGGISPCARRR